MSQHRAPEVSTPDIDHVQIRLNEPGEPWWTKPINPLTACRHLDTLCESCLESWHNDYEIVLVMSNGTQRTFKPRFYRPRHAAPKRPHSLEDIMAGV